MMTHTLNRFRWLWTALAVLFGVLTVVSIAADSDLSLILSEASAHIGYGTLAVISWDAHLEVTDREYVALRNQANAEREERQ